MYAFHNQYMLYKHYIGYRWLCIRIHDYDTYCVYRQTQIKHTHTHAHKIYLSAHKLGLFTSGWQGRSWKCCTSRRCQTCSTMGCWQEAMADAGPLCYGMHGQSGDVDWICPHWSGGDGHIWSVFHLGEPVVPGVYDCFFPWRSQRPLQLLEVWRRQFLSKNKFAASEVWRCSGIS